MTTLRNRTRLERLEATMGSDPDSEIRLFWVRGRNGRGSGGHDGDLRAFLASQGHDMSYGKIRILHLCPHWDGATKTFTPEPLQDDTAKRRARAA